MLNCSLAEGGYYPVMITKTIDANLTLKIKSCSKCHKECGSMPGACYGPHANHCSYGCAHVKVSYSMTGSTLRSESLNLCLGIELVVGIDKPLNVKRLS